MTVHATGQTGFNDIKRKRALAKLLSERSLNAGTATNRNQSSGPIFDSILNLLSGIKGRKLDDEALKEEQALTAGRNDELAKLATAFQGTPDQEIPIQGPVQPGAAPLGNDLIPGQEGGREALVQAMLGSALPDIQGQGLTQALQGPGGGNLPAKIKTFNFFNALKSNAEKESFLNVNRAPQFLDTGSEFITPNRLNPTDTSVVATKQLKPGDLPSVKKDQAQALIEGRKAGEQSASLVEMEANLPRLEIVAGQLSELGETATFTKAGQALDTSRRELGLDPRKSAIARKEYIAKVDNEVLPLLRQTFGAQFTEREGQSLKATLGDPNASPAEKDAVLRSFIDSKRAQVETQRRKLGLPTSPKGGLTEEEQAELDELEALEKAGNL